MKTFLLTCFCITLTVCMPVEAQKLYPIEKGWSKTSVNSVIFRKSSVVSFKDWQYVSYYDSTGNMVLAKRKLGTENWKIHTTRYKGNVADAHNSISLMVDGAGYLHIAWNHHGDSLNYAKSMTPGSLRLTQKLEMTGTETEVTYPEFYRLPNGDLLFFYRSGASGKGNLVINSYDIESQKWENVQDILISGENERNAYWQAFVGEDGTIHISWVWRESWDVATNHDICYARSEDGGHTWMNSKGEQYQLPITKSTAEMVAKVPQNSELINQTSMYADEDGWPYIASYWKAQEDTAVQFRLVYQNEDGWHQQQVGSRKLDFSLSGGGTKKIPVSRPQVMVDSGNTKNIYVIFRDQERDNRASVSFAEITGSSKWNWETKDLTSFSLGSWEPSYDIARWKSSNELHLFIQKVGQGDGESLEMMSPQMVQVLVWKP